MRSQEALFAAGAAVLIGLSAALLMVSGSSVSEAKVVDAKEPVATAATPPAPEEPAPRGVNLPITVRNVHDPLHTSGWTSGTVLGDIWLAASVVPRLQSISVSVQELRAPVQGESKPPFSRVVPVPVGAGTPTFTIRDVPFSEHGFLVRANSPGLNGGQQVVQIDEKHPCAEVRLIISPGVACSVLLRDQDQGPVIGTEVTLFPRDPGRQIHKGKTDNFGSTVLQDVLAGDYVVYAGPVAMPLCEPVELTVQPGTGSIRSQGVTVVVPRGKPVVVAVNDVMDHGIAEAQVKVLATDKSKLSQLEAQTDYSGKATFPWLAPGRYQIDVFKPDFERRSATLNVTEAEAVPEQSFRLVRLR